MYYLPRTEIECWLVDYVVVLCKCTIISLLLHRSIDFSLQGDSIWRRGKKGKHKKKGFTASTTAAVSCYRFSAPGDGGDDDNDEADVVSDDRDYDGMRAYDIRESTKKAKKKTETSHEQVKDEKSIS